MAVSRRGMILILSSPSGAGKTTLTRMLIEDSALDLTLSVSVTTRKQRASEVDGVHYHFLPDRAIACSGFRLFHVLHLLAELLDRGSQLHADIGEFEIVGLGAQRI